MVGCWISILFYRKAISVKAKIKKPDHGIWEYSMAISQSECDKFPGGSIMFLILLVFLVGYLHQKNIKAKILINSLTIASPRNEL